MNFNYLVFDIENDNNQRYDRKAGNFLYDQIVAVGFKYHTSNIVKTPSIYSDLLMFYKGWLSNQNILVGHNIKHDLLFIWKNKELQEWLQNPVNNIIDTALSEYQLTNFQSKYPALREIATLKYGCDVRDKLMEPYWDQGLQTSDIAEGIVLQDVKEDVLDTEKVFLSQQEEVYKQHLQSVQRVYNDFLLATTEMEFNGMKVDLNILKRNKVPLEKELAQKTDTFYNQIEEVWYLRTKFNINSPTHLSVLLFGGSLKEIKIAPWTDVTGNVTVFKTGKHKGCIKTKNIEVEVKFQGLGLKPEKSWATKKAGIFQTNETILNIIAQGKDDHIAVKLVKLILDIRGLNKMISTYFIGTEELVYDIDSCVHPNFNHTSTDTARLSCNKPNVQNQPDESKTGSKVKEHFVSRYL